MAGTPLLTLAEAEMASQIGAMTKVDGYNYNWGTVNEEDLVRSSFPSAVIYLDPEEISLDDPTGIWAGAYLNEAAFLIRVAGVLQAEEVNPVFENNIVLTKALDDLKMLFGTDPSINGTVDMILYRSSTRIRKKNGDIFLPSELETRWIVRYTQSRTSPTTPDP